MIISAIIMENTSKNITVITADGKQINGCSMYEKGSSFFVLDPNGNMIFTVEKDTRIIKDVK